MMMPFPPHPAAGLFSFSGSPLFFPDMENVLAAARESIGPTSIYHFTAEVLTREQGEVTSYRSQAKVVGFLAGRCP